MTIIYLILLVISITAYGFSLRFSFIKKENKRIKDESVVRKYFNQFDENNKLAIIDETPRLAKVGSRLYTLKPLKYRQVTKLCVLFAKVLEKLQQENLDLNKADEMIGKLTELCEEEFFRALAFILYFSENEKASDDKLIAISVNKTFEYLKDNITLAQITNLLEIIIMQNDVQRAIESFGRLALKKKVR